VALCGMDLFVGSIVNTFAALHYAYERAVLPALGMVLEKVLSAGVGILLLRMGAGVQVMAYIILGGSVIDAIWQEAWFFRLVGVRIILQKEIFLALLKGSIPFIAYGVLGVIYYRI